MSYEPVAESDGEAPPAFPVLADDTCCEQFCAALADAGCSIAECVDQYCPVPETLAEFDARQCKNAQADALCCAWQFVGATGCGIGDARQAPECSEEVAQADELCGP